MNRLLVCAGGTYGHVMPALAVIEQLRRLQPDLKVLVVGSRRGAKRTYMQGIRSRPLSSAPLAGVNPLRLPLNLAQNVFAYVSALAIVDEFAPQVALSTGGYPSVAGALATRTLGRPLLLLALDRRPGMAVRLQARIANRICCVDAAAAARLRSRDAVVSGLPLREQFDDPDRRSARRALGLGCDRRLVLVIGGSQGAAVFNRALSSQLPPLLESTHVAHITGARHFDCTQSLRAALPDRLRGRYHPFDFVVSGFADLLAAADLVISRAGAGAVAEITATARPAIFVPGTFAGAHQRENADPLVRAGAAITMDEGQLDRLAATARSLLDDGPGLARMSAASRSLARADAARFVAENILELARHD